MRSLTDQEHRAIVDDLYAESGGDLVGLWEIIRLVEDLVGAGEEVIGQSLVIVTDLLAKGLVVTPLAVTKPGMSKIPTRWWGESVPSGLA